MPAVEELDLKTDTCKAASPSPTIFSLFSLASISLASLESCPGKNTCKMSLEEQPLHKDMLLHYACRKDFRFGDDDEEEEEVEEEKEEGAE